MKYNKLIRDKVLEDLKARNIPYKSHVAGPKEYAQKLPSKLLEEVMEFIRNPVKEEFADILEVLRALKKHHKWSDEEIEEIRLKKFEEKGGFEGGIILEES